MSIKIEQLSFYYGQGTPFETKALVDITMEIKRGDFVGIIGQTGSGKSTLIQHFNGLILPEAGTVYIDGTNIKDKKVKLKLIRQKVGLVFQYPEYQLFEETVFKDVAYGPINLALDELEVERRVKYALELVGFDYSSVKDKSPFDLSGGQKRRVAIAGVLAMKPDYLVLDEPTAGLDPSGRNKLLNTIKKLHENNITIILVSHSMEDIARLADYIYVMYQGRIHMQGTPHEIYKDSEELKRIGLGVPQVVDIMKALKARGMNVDTDKLTIEGATEEILRVLRSKKDA
ncbi:MAG: Cobalt transporter ATP-binding subunit [Clostridiales bacterium 38_11]|nr:MAG: Cobalt transporter ATP-binding subunit [Clostridiales bacterium 38_11]HBH12006.1 energy-coupling factor transporter ATPase [Clostridiales bacterium]